MNIITETTEKQIIKQSNYLVQAKYSLSALATDLLYLMLSEILKEHKELPTFKFRYVDIKSKMNKKINWEKLKLAAKELTNCEIEIDLPDSKFGAHWCSSYRYSKIGERVLELSIDPKLQTYLIDFSDNVNFTLSHFNTISSLRSTYSKRIYTMLMQFANAKTSAKYFVINVDKLKEILEIGEKYKKYSDLKRYIIDIAVKQINESEKTGMIITPEEIKKGRSINRIVFHIERTEKPKSSKTYNKSKPKGAINAIDSLANWLNDDEEIIEIEPLQQIA